MSIRLVVTDIDGTLLDDHLAVPSSAATMIRRLQQAGVIVTIATGRMHASAVQLAQELGIDVPIVSYNGAMIKKGLSGELLYHCPMTEEQVDMVWRLALSDDLAIHFYIDDVLYIRSLHPLSEDYIHTTRCPYQIVPDMRQITKKKGCPTKILIAGQPELLTNLWQQGIKQFGERLYITKSHVHFLEFLNPAVSKGKGVAKLGEILKIPYSQRLVIGDNLNDRELFSGGAVKIAMGNGVQELKDLATWVAPPNDADGWAKAMSRWVFQETIS